ncbi:MAG: hypothetical protein L0Y74_03580 [candidate division Zixibacteria bacterium]|nr:hypothetical protein [candidate division Zixibacteria bacterium]
MQKLIDTVTSQFATGLPHQSKVFQIPGGKYAGRVIIIYPQDSSTLVFRWADFPYQNWSAAEEIAADSADFPAGAFMDEDYNIYVAYTEQTSLDLDFVKLTFSNGVWTVGSAITIVQSDGNYYPSLCADSLGKIYCSWTLFNSGDSRYHIHAKTSLDGGSTWGTGPTDTGTELSGGDSASSYSALIFLPEYAFCIYTEGETLLTYRRRHINAGVWDSEVSLYSGSDLDSNFCVALSDDRRMGVAFKADDSLLYKEYDGNLWSGLKTVDDVLPVSLNLQFQGKVAYLIFARAVGTGQNQLLYSFLDGADFSTPVALNPGSQTFDEVLCYDKSAVTQFSDKTAEAANSTAGDVFHPTSGGLVKDIDDALYLGMDARFNLTSLILSTIGAGGVIAWQYWNGSSWEDFVPSSGAFNLTTSPRSVVLWQDLDSAPADWQKSVIGASSRFWLRLIVITDYSTAPVGSQVTALTATNYLTS